MYFPVLIALPLTFAIELPSKWKSHPNWGLLPKSNQCGYSERTVGFQKFSPRILGGINSKPFKYPWLAFLRYQNLKGPKNCFVCGGSLISKRYILTAAHCCNVNPQCVLKSVMLGVFHTKEALENCSEGKRCDPPTEEFAMEEVIIHKDFQVSSSNHNDICLIRLKKEVVFTPRGKTPICLPVSPGLLGQTLVGKKAVVAGWGLVDYGDRLFQADTVREVEVEIADEKTCASFWISYKHIDGNKICTTGGGKVKGPLNGDSGGPLMYGTEVEGATRTFVLGVVSFGVAINRTDHRWKKEHADSYPVYTRVSSYIGWILNRIRQ